MKQNRHFLTDLWMIISSMFSIQFDSLLFYHLCSADGSIVFVLIVYSNTTHVLYFALLPWFFILLKQLCTTFPLLLIAFTFPLLLIAFLFIFMNYSCQ